MEDKEVGELWDAAHEATHDSYTDQFFTIRQLILKLITERERALRAEFWQYHTTVSLRSNPYCKSCGSINLLHEQHYWTDSAWQVQACKDFGIPVEEFRKAMEGR